MSLAISIDDSKKFRGPKGKQYANSNFGVRSPVSALFACDLSQASLFARNHRSAPSAAADPKR